MKFFSTYLPLILPMSIHVLGSGFAGTCDNISFTGNSTLQADCLEINGQRTTSTVDLNKCITNRDGNLVADKEGGFAGSCRNCDFDGDSDTDLSCECRDFRGDYWWRQIDLDTFVDNSNGNLTCEGADKQFY
ncbi:Cyanovirin-N, partial [Trichoderma evansii]